MNSLLWTVIYSIYHLNFKEKKHGQTLLSVAMNNCSETNYLCHRRVNYHKQAVFAARPNNQSVETNLCGPGHASALRRVCWRSGRSRRGRNYSSCPIFYGKLTGTFSMMGRARFLWWELSWFIKRICPCVHIREYSMRPGVMFYCSWWRWGFLHWAYFRETKTVEE